jgi:hypothetical protein
MIDRIDIQIAELNRLLAARADRKAGDFLARLILRETRERPEREAIEAAKRLGILRAIGPTVPQTEGR